MAALLAARALRRHMHTPKQQKHKQTKAAGVAIMACSSASRSGHSNRPRKQVPGADGGGAGGGSKNSMGSGPEPEPDSISPGEREPSGGAHSAARLACTCSRLTRRLNPLPLGFHQQASFFRFCALGRAALALLRAIAPRRSTQCLRLPPTPQHHSRRPRRWVEARCSQPMALPPAPPHSHLPPSLPMCHRPRHRGRPQSWPRQCRHLAFVALVRRG